MAGDEDEKGEKSAMYRAGGFCLMQGCSSVSLVLLNKYLATFFNYPILTLIGQNTIATILSIIVWAVGIGPMMQPWKKAHFIKVLPMSALFTILLYTSFRTMGKLSIATVVVFRNAGPLCTAVSERMIRNEQFSRNSLIALAMMVVGGFIYGMNDLHYDYVGYMWATFNLLCTTAAGLWGKHLSMDLKSEQSGLGLACYQNIVSVPMFLVVAVLTGESGRWEQLSNTQNVPTAVAIAGLASCTACVTMGVSTFELQRLVSQATVAVANVSYKLVTLLMGMIIYGNNVGMMGFLGLSIAQASACLYVYERQFGTKQVTPGKDKDLEAGKPEEMISLVKRSPTLRPSESKEEV